MRKLLQELNRRSGKKQIYQNNIRPISEASLNNFLRMAETHLAPATCPSDSNISNKPPQVINTYRTGTKSLWSTRVSQYQSGALCKFKWGYFPSHLDHTSKDESFNGLILGSGNRDSDENDDVNISDSDSDNEMI